MTPPFTSSTQSRRLALIVPDCKLLLLLDPIVLDHPRIFPHIITFDLQSRLGLLGLDDEMVIAEGAVFVALFELVHVFSKALLALLTGEDHLRGRFEIVVFGLGVALCAVEPLPTAGRADGDLGIEDVFT